MSDTPKYEQFSRFLHQQILSGVYRPGEKLPSERDLGKQYRIAHMTVNKAVNGLVSAGVLERHGSRGTFVAAASAETQRQVCLLLLDRQPEQFQSGALEMQVYSGITAQAARTGIVVILAETAAAPEMIDTLLQQRGNDLRGILFCGMTHEEKMLNLVERYRSLKFILLNYQLPEDLGYFDNLFKVYNADAEGGAMAAEELYRRGHREFAVLSCELHCRNYARRTDGFRRKLVELGVSNSRIHFRYLDPFRDICTEAVPQAEALTRELLASHPGATAFFAVNDYFASGIATELARVPDSSRYDIIGYDNILPVLSQLGGFSTVAIDFEAIGRRAVELLTDDRPEKIIRIAPRLFTRTGKESGRITA